MNVSAGTALAIWLLFTYLFVTPGKAYGQAMPDEQEWVNVCVNTIYDRHIDIYEDDIRELPPSDRAALEGSIMIGCSMMYKLETFDYDKYREIIYEASRVKLPSIGDTEIIFLTIFPELTI